MVFGNIFVREVKIPPFSGLEFPFRRIMRLVFDFAYISLQFEVLVASYYCLSYGGELLCTQ